MSSEQPICCFARTNTSDSQKKKKQKFPDKFQKNRLIKSTRKRELSLDISREKFQKLESHIVTGHSGEDKISEHADRVMWRERKKKAVTKLN